MGLCQTPDRVADDWRTPVMTIPHYCRATLFALLNSALLFKPLALGSNSVRCRPVQQEPSEPIEMCRDSISIRELRARDLEHLVVLVPQMLPDLPVLFLRLWIPVHRLADRTR